MASNRTIELPPAPEGPDRPVVLARVYPGFHEQAIELFQMDAENLAQHGYVPVAQSYAEGRYPQRLIALSFVLILFLGLGLVLLLFMAAVRPVGTLGVTYIRSDA